MQIIDPFTLGILLAWAKGQQLMEHHPENAGCFVYAPIYLAADEGEVGGDAGPEIGVVPGGGVAEQGEGVQ